jgi:hypothetical protein
MNGCRIVVTIREEAEYARFQAYANGARTCLKKPLSPVGFAKAIADVTAPRRQQVAGSTNYERNYRSGSEFSSPLVDETEENRASYSSMTVHLEHRPQAGAPSQACRRTSSPHWRTGCLTSSSRLELNQATTRGVGDCFGPADYVKLGEDAFYVRLHRSFTNKER